MINTEKINPPLRKKGTKTFSLILPQSYPSNLNEDELLSCYRPDLLPSTLPSIKLIRNQRTSLPQTDRFSASQKTSQANFGQLPFKLIDGNQVPESSNKSSIPPLNFDNFHYFTPTSSYRELSQDFNKDSDKKSLNDRKKIKRSSLSIPDLTRTLQKEVKLVENKREKQVQRKLTFKTPQKIPSCEKLSNDFSSKKEKFESHITKKGVKQSIISLFNSRKGSLTSRGCSSSTNPLREIFENIKTVRYTPSIKDFDEDIFRETENISKNITRRSSKITKESQTKYSHTNYSVEINLQIEKESLNRTNPKIARELALGTKTKKKTSKFNADTDPIQPKDIRNNEKENNDKENNVKDCDGFYSTLKLEQSSKFHENNQKDTMILAEKKKNFLPKGAAKQKNPNLMVKTNNLQSKINLDVKTNQVHIKSDQKKKEIDSVSATKPLPNLLTQDKNYEISLGYVNYLKVITLAKVSGEIVSPIIRKKKFIKNGLNIEDIFNINFVSRQELVEKDYLKNIFKMPESTNEKVPINGNRAESSKFSSEFKKFKFGSKKLSLIKSRNYPSLKNSGSSDSQGIAETVEKEFIYKFNQTLKFGYIPSQIHSQNNLNELTKTKNVLSYNNIAKYSDSRATIPFDDLLKQEYDDNISRVAHDVDNKFSLASFTDLNRSGSKIIAPSQEKLFVSHIHPQNDRSGQNVLTKEKVIVVHINPPIEEETSIIDQADNSIERTLQMKYSSNKKVNKRNNISINEDTTEKRTFESKEIILEEEASIVNDIVHRGIYEGNSAIDDAFHLHTEEIFKFDYIYPSYLTNLNVKSQKLRIKSNFFSFIENLVECSLRGCALKNIEKCYLEHDLHFSKDPYQSLEDKTLRQETLRFIEIFNDAFDYSDSLDLNLYEENFTNQEEFKTDFFNAIEDQEKTCMKEFCSNPHMRLDVCILPCKNKKSANKPKPIILALSSYDLMELTKTYFKLESSPIHNLQTQSSKLEDVFRIIYTLNEPNSYFFRKCIFSNYGSIMRGTYESFSLLPENLCASLQREIDQINLKVSKPSTKIIRRCVSNKCENYSLIPESNKAFERVPKSSKTTIELKPFSSMRRKQKVNNFDRAPTAMSLNFLPSDEMVSKSEKFDQRTPISHVNECGESYNQNKINLEIPNHPNQRIFRFTSHKSEVRRDYDTDDKKNNQNFLRVATNHSIVLPSPPKSDLSSQNYSRMTPLNILKAQKSDSLTSSRKTKGKQTQAQTETAIKIFGQDIKSDNVNQINILKQEESKRSNQIKAALKVKNRIVMVQKFLNSRQNENKIIKIEQDISKIEKQFFESIYFNRLFEFHGMLQLYLKRLPYIRDEEGNNLLMVATKCGNKEALNYLLMMEQIDVNAKNNDGDTALHLAMAHLYDDLADILLKNGAQQSIRNFRGKTPWEVMPKQF